MKRKEEGGQTEKRVGGVTGTWKGVYRGSGESPVRRQPLAEKS